MINEVSSIFWGLSLAVNIILLLIGIPLCLLMCCCCKKHRAVIEKDIKDIAQNHRLLKGNQKLIKDYDVEEMEENFEESPRRRRIAKAKVQPRPTVQVQQSQQVPVNQESMNSSNVDGDHPRFVYDDLEE